MECKLQYRKFLVSFGIIFLVTFMGSLLSNVFGWHAQLGLSDEQATELFQSNPSDPQITTWKNALQKEIQDIQRACFEPFIVPGIGDNQAFELPMDDQLRNACYDMANLVYTNCVSHPGALLACLDQRIAQWAANSSSYLGAINSTVN